MKEKILLIGGGGHGKVVIDALKKSKKYQIHGIIDPSLKGKTVLDIPVLGDDNELSKIRKKRIGCAFISVGSVGNCEIRKKIYQQLKELKYKLAVIVHPQAVIARDVKIEEGTFVAAGAVINAGTKIGRNAIINTSASIDHDCQIGDFVHIAPGATLSGGVKVGDETHIGTGTNVVQYITIGKKAFVKAGSLVVKNISDNERYTGYAYEEPRF